MRLYQVNHDLLFTSSFFPRNFEISFSSSTRAKWVTFGAIIVLLHCYTFPVRYQWNFTSTSESLSDDLKDETGQLAPRLHRERTNDKPRRRDGWTCCRADAVGKFWCDVVDMPASFPLVRGRASRLLAAAELDKSNKKNSCFFLL